MKPSKLFATAAVVFATGLPALALADDVFCPSNLGAVTIDGNVIVDGPCTMTGTLVKGNVLVYDGGALTLRDGQVLGNIQADSGVYVRVLRTDVNGDIQLTGVFGQNSNVSRSTIGGNLQLVANSSRLLAQYNTINGDLQAFSNKGGIVIRYNTIDGNLQCKTNVPRPTGGFNQVSGNKENQCARL